MILEGIPNTIVIVFFEDDNKYTIQEFRSLWILIFSLYFIQGYMDLIESDLFQVYFS